MQFEHGYKYAIGLMNDDYVLSSVTENNITTWTLKENGNHIVKSSEHIENCVCLALDHIVRYLKNPSFYKIKTTPERNSLWSEFDGMTAEEKRELPKAERISKEKKDCYAIYNSDTKAIESWHNENWI